MADIDLNELERLEKAATPGPWVWAEKNSIDFGYVGPNGERTVLFGEDHEGAVHRDDPDGKFLAALRNALPELLRRLRAAEAELAAWKAQGSTGIICQWRKDAERYRMLLTLTRYNADSWTVTHKISVPGRPIELDSLRGQRLSIALDAIIDAERGKRDESK